MLLPPRAPDRGQTVGMCSGCGSVHTDQRGNLPDCRWWMKQSVSWKVSLLGMDEVRDRVPVGLRPLGVHRHQESLSHQCKCYSCALAREGLGGMEEEVEICSASTCFTGWRGLQISGECLLGLGWDKAVREKEVWV